MISIGGVVYTKEVAVNLMKRPVKDDITYAMFYQLVAAKLNVASGSDTSCIASIISAADGWMSSHPLGTKVKASSDAWDTGEQLKNTLDDYNNGLLCAEHCDVAENGEPEEEPAEEGGGKGKNK